MKAIFQFGPFELDPGRVELRRRGVRIRLPVSRIRLLLLLVTRHGDLVTREEIAACLWKDTQNVDVVGGINTAVNHLRSCLGDDPPSPKYIETVVGAGYRFISNVVEVAAATKPEGERLPESRIEESRIEDPRIEPWSEAPSVPSAVSISDSGPVRRWRRTALASAALVAVTSLFFYLLWAAEFRRARPVAGLELARVTDSGEIRFADLSPDGNYLMYVQDEDGTQDVFLKQLATGRLMHLSTVGGDKCLGLASSPDGNYVYFARRKALEATGDLYRVSFLGGTPALLMSGVSGPPAISPDGRRVAFVRSTLSTHGRDSLVAAVLDGSGERVLATYDAPGIHFNRVAWAADGKSLIYPWHSGLMIIPAEGGKPHQVPGAAWAEIDDVRPLPKSNDLIVLGRLAGSTSSQIFEIPLEGGEPRQITHDLSNYTEVRVEPDGKTLLALQDTILSSIQILNPGNESDRHALPDESQNLDGFNGLAWTPDGNIVYLSEPDRRWAIMEADGDGANARRLADSELPSPFSDPVVSPRGDFIAAVRWLGTNDAANIWRMDMNGGNRRRLTNGAQDFPPSITPDGQWIVYGSVQGDRSVLMKVPSQGGPAIRLTDYNADLPAISPDGKWIACFRNPLPGQPANLAIVPMDGGPPAKTFQLPTTTLHLTPAWTPDGRAIGFINDLNGAGNVWKQPVAGGSPQPVTHFTSGRIFNFRWSNDGRLALSGGTETRDAILIRNFRDH